MIEENVPLSAKFIKKFLYAKTKEKVDELLLKIEEYLYAYNEILPPKITPSYEIKYEMFTLNSSDPVGNYVAKKLDKLKEVDSFYNKLTEIMKKLTRDELIYFTDTYFRFIPENIIEQKLHKSSGGLRYIKHSCIIKVALHFGIAVGITDK